MSLIRPEVQRALTRYREILWAVAIALTGAWIALRGGLFFMVLGLIVATAGLALAYIGWQRLRFHREADVPGVVEVTEGQITYLAPQGGGFAARSEISEIALGFSLAGRAHWRISQPGAQALFIPVGAPGADALFDAFAALPGAEPARFLQALDRTPADGPVTVWRRGGRVALT